MQRGRIRAGGPEPAPPHPTSLSGTGQPEPRKQDRKALRPAPWFPTEGLAVKTPLSQGERPALQAWAQLTSALCTNSPPPRPPTAAACLGHWLPHHSGRVSATSPTSPGPHTALSTLDSSRPARDSWPGVRPVLTHPVWASSGPLQVIPVDQAAPPIFLSPHGLSPKLGQLTLSPAEPPQLVLSSPRTLCTPAAIKGPSTTPCRCQSSARGWESFAQPQ